MSNDNGNNNAPPQRNDDRREREAKAYYAKREDMLAQYKAKSADPEGELEYLQIRPYTAPFPTDFGGPKYQAPVKKSAGEKMSHLADGAFNLIFGSYH